MMAVSIVCPDTVSSADTGAFTAEGSEGSADCAHPAASEAMAAKAKGIYLGPRCNRMLLRNVRPTLHGPHGAARASRHQRRAVTEIGEEIFALGAYTVTAAPDRAQSNPRRFQPLQRARGKARKATAQRSPARAVRSAVRNYFCEYVIAPQQRLGHIRV
jgi:hypothetical protein